MCLNLLLKLVVCTSNPPILLFPLPLLSFLSVPRFQVNLSTFPLFSECHSGVPPELSQEESLPLQMGGVRPGKGRLVGLQHNLSLADDGKRQGK